jgi:hypothetical protein
MSTPSDVWSSGQTSARNPDAGLPNVTDLASRTWAELQKDFGGFLLAGLAPVILSQIAGVAMIFVIYGGMGLGAVPGLIIEDELVMVAGSMFGLFGGTFGALALLMLVLAPMHASVFRAVWKYLETGEKLTISSPFSTYTQDLGRVILYQLVALGLGFLGAMMCYLPALVVGAALLFAGPAVYVHGLGVGSAIGLSWRHLLKHPGWHIGFFGISFLMTIGASFVPFIGPMLLTTAHPMFVLLAYRQVFGTGAAPQEDGFAAPIDAMPGSLV